MGRLGESRDLFGCVLWLLSPASEFVTGVVISDRWRFFRVQRRLDNRTCGVNQQQQPQKKEARQLAQPLLLVLKLSVQRNLRTSLL